MALSATDRERLAEALSLADLAIGLSDPNPRVGCVLADGQGRIVARGHTQQAGGSHAEAAALRDAFGAGARLAGGTAWVTLEPCAHHGRTPPCADALVQAGLARVVVLGADPFEQVAGRGLARLRAAGIAVEVAPPDDPLVAQAVALNIGFFSRVRRGRPWVRMKVAASLDGRTALTDGSSQWITSPAARADGQAWRRRAGAVLTGVGTAQADNPRLDVRDWPTARQPLRVVVDSRLSLPPDARLLAPPGEVLVVGAEHRGRPEPGGISHGELAERRQRLQAAGAEVLMLPVDAAPGTPASVPLAALMAALAQRGVNELHLEAGARLNAAFLAAGLVDEWLVYLAPKLLGPGRPMAELAALQALADLPAGQQARFMACDPLGDDLRVRLVAAGDAARLWSGDWLRGT